MSGHGTHFDEAGPNEHVHSLPYDGYDGWFYRCSCGWHAIDLPRMFRFWAYWDWKKHVKASHGASIR
jgi:hypothetical protein